MTKYYLIEWPESQKFMEYEECIGTDDMAYFVPCDLYDQITNPKPYDEEGWAVDGACSGNPGDAEFRIVRIKDGVEIYHSSKFFGTNNIAEFLGLVEAIKRSEGKVTIYTDSTTAISWVKKREINSKLYSQLRPSAWKDALDWLQNNQYDMSSVHKWNTEEWGEIPADFGRK